MRRRVFLLIAVSVVILASLALLATASMADDSATVTVTVVVAKPIHVTGVSAAHSAVPVLRQVSHGAVTFVAP